MEVVFRARSTGLRAAGATVLLSSHILSEVELLCDRVSIIRAGKIVESGTLAELRHLTRTEISFEATEPRLARRDPRRARHRPRRGSGAFTVDSDAVHGVLPVLARRDVAGPADRAAVARGALPAALRRRPGGARGCRGEVMSALATLLRQRMRRDW